MYPQPTPKRRAAFPLFSLLFVALMCTAINGGMLYRDAVPPLVPGMLPPPVLGMVGQGPVAPALKFASLDAARVYVDSTILALGNATLEMGGRNPTFDQDLDGQFYKAAEVDHAFAMGAHDRLVAAHRAYMATWRAHSDMVFEPAGAAVAVVMSLCLAALLTALLRGLARVFAARGGLLESFAALWGGISRHVAAARDRWNAAVSGVQSPVAPDA
jgi:hypothetical protein